MIGIVTKDIAGLINDPDPTFSKYSSYLSHDYVKFAEGSGARVVPIFPSESKETTLKKLKSINGVLFTGNVAIPQSDSYSFSPLKLEEAKARFIFK